MKIEDLSQTDLLHLIERYYAGDKVSNLIKAFGLDLKPNQFVAALPPEELDQCCRHCGNTLFRSRSSRSYSLVTKPPHCPVCGHYELGGTGRCTCPACKEERSQIERAKINSVSEAISSYLREQVRPPRDYATLDIRQKVFLAALLRAAGDETCTFIDRVDQSTSKQPIAPTEEYIREMLLELWNCGAIYVSDESEVEAFGVEQHADGLRVKGVYIFKTCWNVCVTGATVIEMMRPRQIEPDADALSFWIDMSVSEALAYLNNERARVGLDAPSGEKTTAIIRMIVEKYSTAEAVFFIWVTLRDVVYARESKRLNRVHAANCIPVYLSSKFEKYMSEGWEPKSYNRFGAQSLASDILYNNVLGLRGDGFTKRPSLEALGRTDKVLPPPNE
ncbi:hypothetical protein [Magnetospirillum sp. 64-120]|uniref:hypothetical protein n=1 Tax=Magnetospirillum sp. 64-120 TaxID=1895778 RepID=UPI0025BE5C49|nr:hypothetical protein [Magnetospirillum sp. 64-120]